MLLSEPPSWYRLTLWALCPVPLSLPHHPQSGDGMECFPKYTLETSDWTRVLQEIITSEFLCFFIRPMTREILVLDVLIDAPCIFSCIVEQNHPSRKRRILRAQHCTNCNENFIGSNEWENLLSPDFQGCFFLYFRWVRGVGVDFFCSVWVFFVSFACFVLFFNIYF